MNTEHAENLDELIAEEKRLVAEEYFLEAWQAAEADGIDCDILANAFASRLLQLVNRQMGPLETENFLQRLRQHNDEGAFMPERTLQ